MSRTAAILNYTGNTYHWGCHGTAVEIYQTLQERGYHPTYIPVEVTHNFSPSPASLDEMLDYGFIRRALDANPILEAILRDVDCVVVNGEGTLHGDTAGPRNLLFFMHLANNHFGKPVQLINHALFPSDSTAALEPVDTMYRRVLGHLDRVVPRDPYSLQVAQRLGLAAVQGFDCLPRYIARHGLKPRSNRQGPLVLSGGVTLNVARAQQVAGLLQPLLRPGQRLLFLTGAKYLPDSNDLMTYRAMQAVLPALELVNAASMAEWLAAIANASCLISGRFHHTMAAVMLATPFIVFPSNTPKIEAALALLELPPPLGWQQPDFAAQFQLALNQALAGQAKTLTGPMRQRLLQWAAANFTCF